MTLLLIGGLVALYAPVLRDAAAVWQHGSYYSYGFLVPLFSGYLAWEARHRLGRGPRDVTAALLVGVAGLAALGTGVVLDSLTLRVVSLPVTGAALALATGGRATLRALGFPLAFLVFMAPLPPAALGAVSLPLQHLAAVASAAALPLVGIPAVREGLLVHLPEVTLEITEACNGLRFLLAMVVIGTAFAGVVADRWRARVGVVVLAVALGVGANLLRVTGTGVMAHVYGPDAAGGLVHILYGKVVYGAMLVPFVLGVLILKRS